MFGKQRFLCLHPKAAKGEVANLLRTFEMAELGESQAWVQREEAEASTLAHIWRHGLGVVGGGSLGLQWK